MDSEIKKCQNCKKEFVIDSEDFKFYEKIKVPAPTFCPNCRLARKLAWRNERTLYKRICDLCKKNIISMHKPDAVFPVYCHECWWGDEWNSSDYGLDYDFKKSFFEQFKELQKTVPRPSSYSTANINSEYCNHSAHMKNSYLVFGSWFSEDCGYGHTIMNNKNTWNSIFMRKCEYCFYSNDCIDCNQLFFSRQCTACIDSYFIFDCRNCQNCIFSYNLRNKNYHIFNQPVSKEEFNKVKQEIFSSQKSLEEAKNKFEKIIKEKAIHKFMTGERNYKVSGEFISNSKNVHDSYYIDNGENEKYAVRGGIGQKDSMDVFGTHSGELCYETNNIDFSSRCFFSVNGESNINSNYLVDCDHLNNSFGCISVRKNDYCILNKKYSKEEYEELVQKIIEDMNKNPYKDRIGVFYKYGEFFPGELSPFYYNETIAQEYFPLDEEEVKKLGYLWNEKLEEKSYVPTINWNDLPETIEKVEDSILSEIILCEAWDKDKEKAQKHNCTKAFRIIQDELSMYKKYGIPLPTKCPNTRYFEMSSKRNSINFYHRKCMKEGCENEFETSYSPDRPEIVYCEKCYQQEVY
ncbi:MAG: hypothetical protein WC662_00895 [Candidatus Paceibacterota bacterium]|jgi:hypothetical protein